MIARVAALTDGRTHRAMAGSARRPAGVWPSRQAVVTAGAVLLGSVATALALARGPLTATLAFACLGGGALVLAFVLVGPGVLLLWAPLSVVTQPLNGLLPGAGSEQPITFDRLWVLPMVAILLALPRPRQTSTYARGLWIALVLLAAVIGVRTAFTRAPDGGGVLLAWRLWIDSLVLPLVLFCITRRMVALRPAWVERIALSLMVAGGAMAATGIAQHLFGFELATLSGSTERLDQSIGEVRISGPYAVPEVFGLSLVLCLSATCLWLQRRPRPFTGQAVAWLLIAAQGAAVGLTFFRVGWLAALLVVVAVVAVRPRLSAQTAVRIALIGLVTVLALSQLERIPTVQSRLGNTQTVSARLATYEQALDIWALEPLAGVGATRYTDVALSMPREHVGGVASVESPHSSFLGVLAEAGVLGLAALLLALAATWRAVRALRSRAASRADWTLFAVAAAAGLSYLAYALTLTMLPYGASNAFFAVLLGLVAGRLDGLTRESRTPTREPE